MLLVAVCILILTVGLALARLRVVGVEIEPHHAALLGGGLTVATGLVTPQRAGEILTFLTRPVITIVSLMVLTIVAERAGLFRRLAVTVARWAQGDARRLLVALFLLASLTGALFTNDAAILIFTPLVFVVIEQVRQPDWGPRAALPYLFAALFAANIVGPLRISNPIHIILCNVFKIGFLEYAQWMFLPGMVSIAVTLAGLYLYFRDEMPQRCGIPEAVVGKRVNRRLTVGVLTVGAMALVGFALDDFLGVPNVVVAGAAATIALVLLVLTEGSGASSVARDVEWGAILFAVGIFFVANGLRAAGATDLIGAGLSSIVDMRTPAALYLTAFTDAILSAAINNHPVADAFAMTILDLDLTEGEAHRLVFAALIGGDQGPKMLPIGSLAALIWLRILRTRGVHISVRQYVAVGVPVTLVSILVTCAVLHLEAALAGWP